MKKIAFFAVCAAGFFVASCGSEETTEATNDAEGQEEVQEKEAETVTYTLDLQASSLAWKGSEGEDEYHVGTINFSDGSMAMKGEELTEGSFAVDMASMTVTDEGMPEKLKGKLKGHLENDDFFNVPEFPNTQVRINGYSDGNLDLTLTVLGKEVPASVPVSISLTEEGATMTGDFSVNFSGVGMPGLLAEEGEDDSISPEIEFTLNAVMKKS